jgi:hypothetical protein
VEVKNLAQTSCAMDGLLCRDQDLLQSSAMIHEDGRKEAKIFLIERSTSFDIMLPPDMKEH